MLALQRLGHDVSIIQAEQGLRFSNRMLVGDVLFLQRQNDFDFYRLVESIPQGLRPKVVYEIDDLLWNFHGMNNPGAALAKDLQRTVPPMISKADAVICSTPELAEECRKLNPCVHTVLNAVDYQFRDWTEQHPRFHHIGDRKVIGWSGGGWHDGDLQVMGKALRETLLDHPDWCCLMQGDAIAIFKWMQELKLPKKQAIIADWMDFAHHPSIYSLFDVGIAPLLKNAYNRCKSELKLMELGAWGIPYVATDCSPYRRFYNKTGGIAGALAQNEKEWKQCLGDMIANEGNAIRSEGTALRRLTAEHYSLEARAKEYEKVLYSIIGQEVCPRAFETVTIR